MTDLPIVERAILAKPIPFLDHLQDLFSDCPVDGAFMTDPFTSTDFNDDQLEIQDPLNMVAACAETRDPDGADLDKIVLEGADDCHEVAASSGAVPCEVMSGTSAPSAQPSGSFAESTMASLKPIWKKCKIVGKAKPNTKPQAPAPHDGRNRDVLNNTLVAVLPFAASLGAHSPS